MAVVLLNPSVRPSPCHRRSLPDQCPLPTLSRSQQGPLSAPRSMSACGFQAEDRLRHTSAVLIVQLGHNDKILVLSLDGLDAANNPSRRLVLNANVEDGSLTRGRVIMLHLARLTFPTLCLAIGLFLAGGSSANACSIILETKLEKQQRSWEQSGAVYLARIERLRAYRVPHGSDGRQGTLVPVGVIKGHGPIPKVNIFSHPDNGGDCIFQPTALEAGSVNGDLFVVYSSYGTPIRADSIYMDRVEDVVHPALLRRLLDLVLDASFDRNHSAHFWWLGLFGLLGLLGLRGSRMRANAHW